MRTVIKVLLLLTFLLPSNSHSGSSEKIMEPLPDFFHPFKWTMDLSKLGKIFPNTVIKEAEHTTMEAGQYKKTKVITISGLTWKYFGPAYIRIHYADKADNNQDFMIKRIFIITDETRPECEVMPGESAPEWCRFNYNDELLQIFNTLRKDIAKKYGQPKGPQRPIDSIDKREAEYIWKREGFDLFLDITKGEQEDWQVSLIASQN